MKLPHPFIQLPLKYDAKRLAGEVLAIEEQHWRPHPQGYAGNTMLPLVAINGDPANEEFRGQMAPTPHLKRCPYVRQVIASLGVTAGRTRLMRLDGNAEVTEHADQHYYWMERVRVHIPIVTQPTVRFECGGAAVNMAAGECWIFDTWRLHRVLNPNEDRRIHLVIDTVGGARFWQLVEAGRPQPLTVQTPQGWAPKLLAYEPGAEPSLALETENLPRVMSPWEAAAHLSFLLGEAGQHPKIAGARRTVSVFIRDWRALWSAYGDSDEGRPHFARRMQEFINTFRVDAEGVKMPNGMPLFDAMISAVGAIAIAHDVPAPSMRAMAMSDGA